MKLLLLTSLFSLILPATVNAQPSSLHVSTCSNEIVEKISSRGIKIGIKIDELLGLFASDESQKLKLRNSASGAHDTHFGIEFFGAQPLPIDATPDGRFEGISDYRFTILDGRLAGFTVHYSKPQWKDSRQFTETLIKALDLPSIEKWDGIGRLYCGDYKIMADSGGFFLVEDERIKKIIADRKEKYEEDQRLADLKKFRP